MCSKTILLPQYRKSKWGTNYKTHRRYLTFPYIKVKLVDYCFVKAKKKKTKLKLILFLCKDIFDRHKDYIILYCKYNFTKKIFFKFIR